MIIERLRPFFIVILLLLSACSHYKKPTMLAALVPPTPPKPYTALPAFTAITASGPFDIQIETGKSKHAIQFQSKRKANAYTHFKKVDDQLYLRIQPGYTVTQHGRIKMIIHMKQLHQLNYYGDGRLLAKNLRSPILKADIRNDGQTTLTGHIGLRTLKVGGSGKMTIRGIQSRHLSLVMQDKPHIELRGMTNLHDLQFSGDGHLDMYWIDSPYLKIIGKGNAYVRLAGIVTQLDAIIGQHAHLNARYLRVTDAYVKGRDQATIRLTARKTQNTLAVDESHIYFYKDSKQLNTFMRNKGAVLSLQGIN